MANNHQSHHSAFISLLAVIVLLTITSVVRPEVVIDTKDRVKNMPPGCCMWASLETLAKHRGIKELYGITKLKSDEAREYVARWNGYRWEYYKEWRNGELQWAIKDNSGGTAERVTDLLNAKGVRFHIQHNKTVDKLVKACDDNEGCVVVLNHFPLPDELHAVVLVDIDAESVKVIDPNRPSAVFSWPRYWFNHHWTGYSVFILEK